MSHEFQIHHYVSELVSTFGLKHRGPGAEVYAEILQNISPYVTTQQADVVTIVEPHNYFGDHKVINYILRYSHPVSTHAAKSKLAESTTTPQEFLEKYEELKSKNVRDLDPLVYLMSKLSEDKQTLKFLRKHSESRASRNGRDLSVTQGLIDTSDSCQSINSQLTSQASSKFTKEELERIKAQLMKQGTDSTQSTAAGGTLLKKLNKDKQNKQVNIPSEPEWLMSRRHLTLDFLSEQETNNSSQQEILHLPIGSLPLHEQESLIIEDLLYCVEGVDGKYIQSQPVSHKHAVREFKIDPSLDSVLKELVKKILPLCSNYSLIVRFIEEKSQFEYGLVNQALSAALTRLIKDYFLMVAQLEHDHRMGQLTLQKFWYFMQPSIHMMNTMVEVVNSINKEGHLILEASHEAGMIFFKDIVGKTRLPTFTGKNGDKTGDVVVVVLKGDCKGGAVLSLLHEKASSLNGNPSGRELCLYLIQSACVPYFEILEKWIYKGIIVDPYSEFLVKENEEYLKEKLQEDYNYAYWEQHYTICDDRIPTFLERISEKILNTGKYLNVVRQCGREVSFPYAKEVLYSAKEGDYYEHIEKAYDYASKLLLELLMQEKELMSRLRSIKHYFLLDQGDFILQFMDMAEDEMKKPMNEVSQPRLEALLELVLRTSTANEDPFKDDLKVVLLSFDIITQLFKVLAIETKHEKEYRTDPTDLRLSGLESFSFDYIVKWPVSLVVSRKSLLKYQMLFRHLFYCKHVERRLCSVWLGNKQAKVQSLNDTRWYAAAFTLRQRMLNFVQNFEYYMTFEVIEPNWCTFEKNMESVSNIDDVLMYHNEFLTVCLKDCMLMNSDLLRILHKLCMVCITFSNFMQRQSSSIEAKLSVNDSTFTAESPAPKRNKDETFDASDSDDFQSSVADFDTNFSTLLVQLLDNIMEFSVSSSEHKLMNILYRLDFNNFYTKQLQNISSSPSLTRSISVDDYSTVSMGMVKGKGLSHHGSSSTLGSAGPSLGGRSRVQSSRSPAHTGAGRSASVDFRTKR